MPDLHLPKASGLRWKIERRDTDHGAVYYAVKLQKRRWFKWETVLTDTTITGGSAQPAAFKSVALKMYDAYNHKDPYEGIYR